MYSIINSIKGISFMSEVFYNNTVFDYILFVVTFILLLFLIRPTIKILVKLFSKLASSTTTTLDDEIVSHFSHKHSRTLFPLELSIAFFVSIQLLQLPSFCEKIISGLSVVLITIFLVTSALDILKYIIINK